MEETLSGFLNASCGDRAGFVSRPIMCHIVSTETWEETVLSKLQIDVKKKKKWKSVNADHVFLQQLMLQPCFSL